MLTVDPAPVAVLGTYRGYLNGNLFIETKNISKADALANCKTNASNNPSAAIRCTWNDAEIFRSVAPSEVKALVAFKSASQVLTPGHVPASVSYGTYVIQFEVTADDGDIYIPRSASVISNSGANYAITGSPAFDGTYTASLSSDASETNGYYLVQEGDTEVFRLNVALTPRGYGGTYAVRLTKLNYATSAKTPDKSVTLPVTGYSTQSLAVTNGSDVLPSPSVRASSATINPVTVWGNRTITVTGTVTAAGTPNLKVYAVYPTATTGTLCDYLARAVASSTTRGVISAYPVTVSGKTWSASFGAGFPQDSALYVCNASPRYEEPALAVYSLYAARHPVTVGVYEGAYPAGVRHSYGVHPEGTVTVNITGPSNAQARPLVLTAYEPVNWVIKNPYNVPISKIITVGYYKQRVTAAAGIPVQSYSYQAGTSYSYTYQSANPNFWSWLSKTTGLEPWLFYGSYSGASFYASFSEKG